MKLIVLKIIGTCNSNCTFCMIPREDKKKRYMSYNEILHKIGKIKNEDVLIDLFGGEPTIHPQFFKVLKYIRQKGYRCTLATNARLFSYKKYVKRLKEIGIFEVRSSLHGHNSELHDMLTNSPGSFDQAVQGFRNLIDEKIPLVVNTVIYKNNIDYMKEIADLLIEIGIKNIKISGLCFSGNMRYRENNKLVVSLNDIKKKLSGLFPYLIKNKINFSIEKLPICLFPEHSENFIIETDQSIFTKEKICKKCLYDNVCMGISNGYIERGFEFHPFPIEN